MASERHLRTKARTSRVYSAKRVSRDCETFLLSRRTWAQREPANLWQREK